VCSLQVLPFTFKQKAPAARMTALTAASAATPEPENSPTAASRRTSTLAHPIVRAPYVVPPTPSAPRPKPAPIDHVASDYPVFWVEAWSVPAQRWITVDSLVTRTVATPTALEPPLSDLRNTLSYVLAFEDTSHATDVTRRYAAYLLARTRRSRVHSTKGGDSWFRRILRRNFHRGYTEDRDQLEAAEFAKLSLDEPMPKAVQDFRDHPVFALKRHLRRDQIISPERKVGTVQSGKGRTETVFRRQDVKEVKTVEQWYKLGREALENEIPLKFTAPRTRARRGDDGRGEEEDEALPHQPMFALAQTKFYTPPPVVNGIVPKNRFGNLDVFVPSMVPAGGVHIPHKTARNAARILGIDFVDVVTGFEFRNRIASPLVKGVVVASEYGEAVEAVVEGFEWEAEMEAERQRGLEALRLWGRWLLRLRIRERLGVGSDEIPVARFTTDGKRPGAKRRSKRRVQSEGEEEDEDEGEEEDEETGEEEDGDEEGGFLADIDDEEVVRRRSRRIRRAAVDGGGEAEGALVGDCGGGGGGFLADEDGGGGGGGGFVSVGDGSGGGFLPDDGHGCGSVLVGDGSGGGFLPDDGHGCGSVLVGDGSGGGFLPDDGHGCGSVPVGDGSGGGFLPDDGHGCGSVPVEDGHGGSGGGGGFLPATPSAAHEEEETGGGGFLPVAEADACVSRSLGEEEDDDDDEEPDWDLLGL